MLRWRHVAMVQARATELEDNLSAEADKGNPDRIENGFAGSRLFHETGTLAVHLRPMPPCRACEKKVLSEDLYRKAENIPQAADNWISVFPGLVRFRKRVLYISKSRTTTRKW